MAANIFQTLPERDALARRDAMLAAYRNGDRVIDIADRFAVTVQCVQQLARYHGLKRRIGRLSDERRMKIASALKKSGKPYREIAAAVDATYDDVRNVARSIGMVRYEKPPKIRT